VHRSVRGGATPGSDSGTGAGGGDSAQAKPPTTIARWSGFLERRGPATGAAWELHDGVVLVAAGGEIQVPGRGDRTFRLEANVLTGDDGCEVVTAAASLAPA